HLRIEEISRRLWAPPIEGGLQETHWFYERARGQFANAQANFTPAKKREFLLKNPRAQMFTKTDLAKFEQSFHMLPHEVSKGAQKNFAKYASQVGKNWEKDEDRFNDLFFRKLIAKAIVFRYLDRQIMRQAWYGGYKANIVTYTISKLVQVIGQQDKQLDLMRIWQAQQLSSPLERLLISIATKVNQMIQVTPDGITNVTEYCKKDLCWQKVGAMHVPLNEDISADLVSLNLVKELETEAVQIRKIDNGIQAQSYILENGAEYWRNLLQWGRQENLLSELDEGVLITAARIPNRIPSEKQSLRILDVENRMIAEGFHKE
ncbi:MAG: AIPR family protein, partial [Calditrichaeota bacterium]|nr:AIPR family protein [Calditrichota bacterium]